MTCHARESVLIQNYFIIKMKHKFVIFLIIRNINLLYIFKKIIILHILLHKGYVRHLCANFWEPKVLKRFPMI